MLATQNDAATMQVLQQRLADARQRTDELFGLVKPDSLYERPIAERHRIIFYIGHLEAFDWNLLGERVFGLKGLHPEFDRLFAFGIDPVGGGLPDDPASAWPAATQVREYAAKDSRIVPFVSRPIVYNDNLRCVLFDQFRDRFEAGDWILKIDADEFYHVPPPRFVKERMRAGDV